MLITRADLTADLRGLGLGPGDAVLAHGALGAVGDMIDGPDTIVGALLDAVSPGGTVLAYTDWNAPYVALLDEEGRVPEDWREHVPPFDPATSRAIRENGAFPEFLRTTPGAHRSRSAGASFAAIGAHAEWFTADTPIDYGYGPGSPLARLVEVGGKVAMLGAPWDTMTLLHHAEHLADLPGKRVVRVEVPFRTAGGTAWRWVEEFDTSDPVVEGFDEDYFLTVVEDFVATGEGKQGRVGRAPSLVVDAAPMCAFAVAWMEARGR
ncbi:aminoglycoside 3-N-acetyltransferase [Actinomycetospora termitidis]|uniref:Aminoglycoside N(3)-acetyltransferase n=1 Tax=Actinomycetospora termitidis TaxID=3053470 RepID=A0ABT7M3R1_9PSEU|nr:aminoglycoside 3-N-acetyltransferase [Actinomycetospora sp. Odt1-22]MDL5155284.1 aminoglycoside 3-N-acetyltransferase [Actinomycetospora sp. Odt1-22]